MKSEYWKASAGMWRALAEIARGPLATAGLQSLAVQVAAIGLGLVQAVALARLLGAADYGMFATAMGVSAILAAIAVGGFDQYAVRELSRLRADGDFPTALAFIRFGNRAALAASLLAGAGLALVAGAYADTESDWRNTFMLAAAATPFATLLLLRAGQLRGLGAVVIAQLPIAMVRPSAMIVLLGAFWMAGLTMTALHAMTAWLAACFAALILASAVLHSHKRSLNASAPAPALTRKWFVDTTPFFGSTIVGIAFGQMSTLMLSLFDGAEAAGLFQPIAHLAPVMAIPVAALAMPFAPRVVELWRHSNDLTLQRITYLYTVLSLCGTCLLGTVVLLLSDYVLALFGPEFVAVTPALQWIVTAYILFAMLGPSEILLSMMDAHRVVLLAQTLAFAVTFALAAMLIPYWSITGAAMAFSAGIVTGRLFTTVYTIHRRRFDPSLIGALQFASQHAFFKQ